MLGLHSFAPKAMMPQTAASLVNNWSVIAFQKLNPPFFSGEELDESV